jgi:hypothetical protein
MGVRAIAKSETHRPKSAYRTGDEAQAAQAAAGAHDGLLRAAAQRDTRQRQRYTSKRLRCSQNASLPLRTRHA